MTLGVAARLFTNLKTKVMRKIVLFFMLLCLALIGCEKSPEERAEELVTEGITNGANDPSSVQDVKLYFIKKKEFVDAQGKRYWEHEVSVEYREKNEYGALVRRHCDVIFNEDFTKILSWDGIEYSVRNNW